MASNDKNRLQEFFQKRGLELPTYKHHQSDAGWCSSVSFVYEEKDYNIQGGWYPNKRIADVSAAHQALDMLTTTPSSQPKITLPPNTVLLVDVENLPRFVDEVVRLYDGLDIYAFIGEHHCLADIKLPPNVTKIISPSTRPDGTDTCIQVHVGFLLATSHYQTYLIASRDHFASALVDIITHDGCMWTAKQGKMVTSVHQLVK